MAFTTSLSMVILERYELKEVICKNIETRYMLLIRDLLFAPYAIVMGDMQRSGKGS